MGFFDDVVDNVLKPAGKFLGMQTKFQRGLLKTVGHIASFGATTAMEQQRGQRYAQREQERVSAQALQASQNQASLAMQEQNKANQRRPDIAAILARTIGRGQGGASSTMLTGVGGVPKKNLKLGDTSLLGE